jgi:hypothetical protein
MRLQTYRAEFIADRSAHTTTRSMTVPAAGTPSRSRTAANGLLSTGVCSVGSRSTTAVTEPT